ncbi:MAG TPA: TetR/AcrR family transcriptional regulator C-terminal domain-containing protein [Pseudonocardiaceae bacterium]|jgi:TetR/AcrR family tetracycline transcriptional repressor|nr:TetR/AcrR family transcriptional regulator C-terminal domain-containing protein [Pseudonocardiaceae bacterium]
MSTTSSAPVGGRVGEVVHAALELLDEQGLDAVSLRAVAGRLGVRLNTVLWHVKTKARLRELMADAIVAEVRLDGLPADARERVVLLARRYREALLGHRDGGLVVAGASVTEPATLDYAEAIIGALLAAGLADREAGWTCWTLTYFILGLVQEEQGSTGPDAEILAPALAPERHPAMLRVLPHLVDGDFASRFEFGLRLMLAQIS